MTPKSYPSSLSSPSSSSRGSHQSQRAVREPPVGRRTGVPVDEYRRQEIHPWLLSHRGHSLPGGYPRVRRIQLHWTLNLKALPLREAESLAALYGWSQRSRELAVKETPEVEGDEHALRLSTLRRASVNPTQRRGGRIRRHQSGEAVASRRVRTGDRMGVTRSLLSPRRANQFLGRLLDDLESFRKEEHRERLHPQELRSNWSDPHGSLRSDTRTTISGMKNALGLPRYGQRPGWDFPSGRTGASTKGPAWGEGQFDRARPSPSKLPCRRQAYEAYHRRSGMSERSLSVVWSLPGLPVPVQELRNQQATRRCTRMYRVGYRWKPVTN